MKFFFIIISLFLVFQAKSEDLIFPKDMDNQEKFRILKLITDRKDNAKNKDKLIKKLARKIEVLLVDNQELRNNLQACKKTSDKNKNKVQMLRDIETDINKKLNAPYVDNSRRKDKSSINNTQIENPTIEIKPDSR